MIQYMEHFKCKYPDIYSSLRYDEKLSDLDIYNMELLLNEYHTLCGYSKL